MHHEQQFKSSRQQHKLSKLIITGAVVVTMHLPVGFVLYKLHFIVTSSC
jgi:hypothetical protein